MARDARRRKPAEAVRGEGKARRSSSGAPRRRLVAAAAAAGSASPGWEASYDDFGYPVVRLSSSASLLPSGAETPAADAPPPSPVVARPAPSSAMVTAAPRSARDDVLPSQEVSSPRLRDDGTRLGRYRLLEQLGKGGYGTVYKAWDPQLERHVAVKLLLRADERSFQRFAREITTTARLHHPNIVAVHDSGAAAGRPYLVMEFVEGRTLWDLGKGDLGLGIADAVRVVRDAARAIHYAHEQGILHRDIKPANVLVSPDGHARVLDFGLARHYESSRLTRTGAVVGTPLFMSPEQAQGETVDEASDTYALGACLYYALTGRPPHLAESLKDLIAAMRGFPERPSRLNPDVPRELDAICIRALHPDRQRRYGTAGDLALELDLLLETLLLAAPERPAARRPRSGVHALAAAGLGAATVLAVGAAVLVGRGADDPVAAAGTPAVAEAATVSEGPAAAEPPARVATAAPAVTEAPAAATPPAPAEAAPPRRRPAARKAGAAGRLAPLPALELGRLEAPAREAIARRSRVVEGFAREDLVEALERAAEGRPWRDVALPFQRAVRAAPEAPGLALEHARVLVGRDRHSDAGRALERARGLGADPLELARLDAELAWRRGSVAAARAAFAELAARDPRGLQGRCAAAHAAYLAGDPDAALEAAAAALDLEAGHVPSLLVRSQALTALGRIREAKRAALRAHARGGAADGRVAAAWLAATVAELGAGRVEDVAARLDAELLVPTFLAKVEGAFARVVLAAEAARHPATLVWAEDWLSEAANLEPERADVYLIFGEARLRGGAERDEVQAWWLKARTLDPTIRVTQAQAETFRERFGATPRRLEGLFAGT